jgi:hypothetical protein
MLSLMNSLGQQLGQCHSAGPGDRGGRGVGRLELGADAQDVDDPAAAAALHMRDHQPGQAHRGHQLELDAALPGRVVGQERHVGGLPGVVDQDVGAAAGFGDLGHERLELLGPGDVGGQADRRAVTVGIGQFPGDTANQFGAAGDDDDPCPLRGQPSGNAAADARGRAGDDRDVALQRRVHVSDSILVL